MKPFCIAGYNRNRRAFIRNPANQRAYAAVVLAAIPDQWPPGRLPDDVKEIRDRLKAKTPPRNHLLWGETLDGVEHNFDPHAPASIKDGNGEIVLALCRICGLAESQLDETPVCPGLTKEK